jgi:hypothetical protein
MVLHHAHPDSRLILGDTGSNRHDDAARLMSGNDGTASSADSQRGRASGRAVKLEVAAAHPRRFDLQHNLAGTRRRVGEFKNLDFAIASKYDTFHF